MPDLVTLLQLRTRAKSVADQLVQVVVQDSEWNDWINYGCKRLYDLLVSSFGDEYYLKSYSVPLVSGVDTYALPSDFYRERAVDVLVGGQNISATRFLFKDRNKYNWANISWAALGCTPLYTLQGNNIKFMPAPNITGSGVTLWYIPTMQKTADGGVTWASGTLSADADGIDGVNGYEELVVLEAAIRALQKEESDPSLLVAQRDEVARWIEGAVRNRNAGDPSFVGDVNDRGGFFIGF